MDDQNIETEILEDCPFYNSNIIARESGNAPQAIVAINPLAGGKPAWAWKSRGFMMT